MIKGLRLKNSFFTGKLRLRRRFFRAVIINYRSILVKRKSGGNKPYTSHPLRLKVSDYPITPIPLNGPDAFISEAIADLLQMLGCVPSPGSWAERMSGVS